MRTSSSDEHPCFNSRTREGCDEAQRAYNEALREFQFTHPGGVRRNNQ